MNTKKQGQAKNTILTIYFFSSLFLVTIIIVQSILLLNYDPQFMSSYLNGSLTILTLSSLLFIITYRSYPLNTEKIDFGHTGSETSENFIFENKNSIRG